VPWVRIPPSPPELVPPRPARSRRLFFAFDSPGLTVYIRLGQSRTILPKPADNHGIARGTKQIDTIALTARQVESAKPKEKPCKLGDAGGLYLYVAPTGLKS